MRTRADIKKSIKREHILSLQKKIRICKSCLADPNWASTDSDYHKECRIEKELEIKYFSGIIKRLDKFEIIPKD